MRSELVRNQLRNNYSTWLLWNPCLLGFKCGLFMKTFIFLPECLLIALLHVHGFCSLVGHWCNGFVRNNGITLKIGGVEWLLRTQLRKMIDNSRDPNTIPPNLSTMFTTFLENSPQEFWKYTAISISNIVKLYQRIM